MPGHIYVVGNDSFEIKPLNKANLEEVTKLSKKIAPKQNHWLPILKSMLRREPHHKDDRNIYTLGVWHNQNKSKPKLIAFVVAETTKDYRFWADKNTAYKIYALAVDANYQKQGHATQLLLALIKEFHLPNVNNVIISINKENVVLHELAKKYGFNPYVRRYWRMHKMSCSTANLAQALAKQTIISEPPIPVYIKPAPAILYKEDSESQKEEAVLKIDETLNESLLRKGSVAITPSYRCKILLATAAIGALTLLKLTADNLAMTEYPKMRPGDN